ARAVVFAGGGPGGTSAPPDRPRLATTAAASPRYTRLVTANAIPMTLGSRRPGTRQPPGTRRRGKNFRWHGNMVAQSTRHAIGKGQGAGDCHGCADQALGRIIIR